MASAPVSYGAFEITIGVDPNLPDPLTLLGWVQNAGYEGIEPRSRRLPRRYRDAGERLSDHELGLACGRSRRSRTPAPRPGLATRAEPRWTRPSGLDAAAGKHFAQGVARAAERCRARGYDPTFRHHTATYVEAQWEIERLLEVTAIGLCLETGHLVLGGGEPIAAIRDWASRINQVHLKDARVPRLAEIVAEAAPVQEIWRRPAFCALGDGDIDVEQVLDALLGINYSGWLVVEQGVLPDPANPTQPARDQKRDRDYLRGHGL